MAGRSHVYSIGTYSKTVAARATLSHSPTGPPSHRTSETRYCPCLAYFASVASFASRHQSSCSVYQAMVWSSPSEKLV